MRETVSSLVRYGGFGLGRFTVIWLISPPFQCSTRRAVWLAASAVMTTSSSRVCRSSLRSRSVVDGAAHRAGRPVAMARIFARSSALSRTCLLYTSDAADDLLCVDLGGRRI